MGCGVVARPSYCKRYCYAPSEAGYRRNVSGPPLLRRYPEIRAVTEADGVINLHSLIRRILAHFVGLACTIMGMRSGDEWDLSTSSSNPSSIGKDPTDSSP